MVTPVPAQISNLPPRLRAARRRFHFRSRHSGASSTSRTPVRDLPTLRHFDTLSSPLCFHTLANPSSRNLFIFTSRQNPRGCTLQRSRRQTFRPSNLSTLLFASAWRLFVVSLHSFLHSFPLFSIVCSLFAENTRVGGTSTAYSRHSLTPSETEGSLATFNRPAHLTPAPRDFMLWRRLPAGSQRQPQSSRRKRHHRSRRPRSLRQLHRNDRRDAREESLRQHLHQAHATRSRPEQGFVYYARRLHRAPRSRSRPHHRNGHGRQRLHRRDAGHL